MLNHRPLRYTMFGLLYFVQGTILSYFTALNALYFLSRGLTMTSVGIFSAIALIPFVIKIFLGMLSDRVNLLGLGHRKPYILIGLAVQTVCLFAAPFIDPARYYWGFVLLAFTLQMGMALYDTCTDGLALDTTPKSESGTIQGFMVGGRALGVVVTASAVGLLAQNVSWLAVFWLLAVLTLIPIPLVLGVREGPRPVERTFDWGAFRAFKAGNILALSGVGFLFFFIIAGSNQIVNPFLQSEFNISLSTAGFTTTIWGIGVILGGFFSGLLMSRLGQKNTVRGALFLSLASVLGLAFILSPSIAWPLVGFFGVAYGACQTVYYALAMTLTDQRIAASMFSILMAVTNIAQGVGMAVAGLLVDASGYRWTFAVLAALNLLALPLLKPVFGRAGQPARGSPSSVD
jgi:PAT family beta-lactamase induction signal transducer AmpG